jgi:hypothetical protein
VTGQRRSRQLGQDFYLRNFGVYLLVYFITSLLGLLLTAIIIFFTHLEIAGFFVAVVDLLFYPLGPVPPVLLYYDMTVRKEDYGAPQLAEDLKY